MIGASNKQIGDRSAIVFGAGDGLGKALAEVYLQAGYQVTRVSRPQCNLSDLESTVGFCEKLRSDGDEFDLCIFAAGVCCAGYFRDLPLESFQQSFAVHFFAPLALMKHFAQQTKRNCRYIFVLSGTTELFLPGLSAYSLSKRALRDLIRFTTMEWPQTRVLRVWPGPMKTRFNEKAKIFGNFVLPPLLRGRRPEAVAQKIFYADSRNRSRLVISPAPFVLGRLLTPNMRSRLQWAKT